MNIRNEATLQAELFHALRLLGLFPILELDTPAGRLDLVLLSQDQSSLLAIVEVKEHPYQFKTSQLARYRLLGVPVFTLCYSGNPHALASQLFHSTFTPVPLSHIRSQTQIKADRKMVRQSRRNERLRESLNLKD
jgi:hypothetical protein